MLRWAAVPHLCEARIWLWLRRPLSQREHRGRGREQHPADGIFRLVVAQLVAAAKLVHELRDSKGRGGRQESGNEGRGKGQRRRKGVRREGTGRGQGEGRGMCRRTPLTCPSRLGPLKVHPPHPTCPVSYQAGRNLEATMACSLLLTTLQVWPVHCSPTYPLPQNAGCKLYHLWLAWIATPTSWQAWQVLLPSSQRLLMVARNTPNTTMPPTHR